MSACPAISDFIPANSLSLKGKVSATKDDSFVLPVMAWWRFGNDPEEFWDGKEVLAGDLDSKNSSQGLCVTVDVKAGSEFPDGERVLEAFKSSPFVRTSTVLARKGYYSKKNDRYEQWRMLPPKYGFQIDCDDCTREQLDAMTETARSLGANGYVAREKSEGHWSCNIVFFQSNGYYKEYAKGIALEVAELLSRETGAEICQSGTRNDLIKNPWAVRRLVELENLNMHLEGRFRRTKGPRGGTTEVNLWTEAVEGRMVHSVVLDSEVEIWREGPGSSWEELRNKTEEMLDVDENVWFRVEKEEEVERESVRNEMLVLLPSQKESTTKTPYEHFPGYGKNRHDTISVLWKSDLKACWRKHGRLPWDEILVIYRKWEKVAGEMTGKGDYGKKGLAWLRRNWKTLNNKKPEWLAEEDVTNLGMVKRVAGKLIRIAKLAVELNIEGKLKKAAEKVLASDEVMKSKYLQKVMNRKVKGTTEWRYKKDILEETRWMVSCNDVLGVDMGEMNKGERELMETLRILKEEMERGEETGRESVRNEMLPPKRRTSPSRLDSDSLQELNRIKNEGFIHVESGFDPDVELAVALDNMHSCEQRCLWDEAEMWRKRAIAFGYEPPRWKQEMVSGIKNRIDSLLGKNEETSKPQSAPTSSFSELRDKINRLKGVC